eukprot:9131608-Alexandrium_andersonii.AAC.1
MDLHQDCPRNLRRNLRCNLQRLALQLASVRRPSNMSNLQAWSISSVVCGRPSCGPSCDIVKHLGPALRDHN